MKTSSCTRKPANAYLQMTTGSNRQRLQAFAFVRFDTVDICKFFWSNMPVKQIERRATKRCIGHQLMRQAGGAIEVACLSHSKGGEDTNTQYIILGNKVVLVDADLGIVLEEFDYPV